MTEQERIELLKKVAELKAGLEFIAGQRITSSYQVGFKIDSMRDKAEEILPLLDTLAKELKEAEAKKDGAYLERNRLVALLAKLFPSGVAKTAIEGWSEDWHGCVYIDFPTGQASWHFHDSQAWLFEGLPPYKGSWDGHTTEEKYERIAAIEPRSIQSLEAEVARLREALAFAESCIKSGEPWTQTCEEMFGKAREALGGGE